MVPVIFVDLGIAFIGAGLLLLIRPIARVRVGTRTRAGAVLAAGLVFLAIGFTMPAREQRARSHLSFLDDVMPVWQFVEVHERVIAAPPDVVWRALREVTAGEIRFFTMLTTIRRFGRSGPESMLNAPERKPLLDVALRSGFQLLAEQPPTEIVVGTMVVRPAGAKTRDITPAEFIALSAGGYAKAAMNFRVEPRGTGTLLHTETRVFATDDASRRSFARYWRIIYPGSALIRRQWLRAVDKRATRTSQ